MSKRRELFSSLAFTKKNKQESNVVRPPYFESEDIFSKCADCAGECVKACDENIIKFAKDNSPILDFSHNGCTYCDKCALACEYGVLKLVYKKSIKATFKIDILKCLSWQKTMCFSCKEVCLDDAINFLALFRAEIDYEKCTNCGFCLGICPTNAIKIEIG